MSATPQFIRSILLAVVPPLYVALTRLWFSTFRVTVRDEQYIDDARKQGAVIVPFWHYSILYMFHHVRHYRGVALISASSDGDYIAKIAELMHFEAVRGSSNKQGTQALKKLLRAMKAGKHIGIVADGSQGPARRFQPGAVFLSSRTGAPMLPMVWSAKRYITFGSWDRTVLPYPFTRIIVRYGKPVNVSKKLDSEGIEHYRMELENIMNDLYLKVWQEFGVDGHDDGPGERNKA